MNAVVVGGGIAGLLAAHRLTQAGHRVTVREAAPRWGGMVAPVEVAGLRVDCGAEAFVTRGGAIQELCRELCLEVAAPVSDPYIWWSDGPHHLAHGIMGIPGSLDDPALSVLSPEERARFEEDLTIGPEVGQSAQTFGELVRLRLGDKAVAKLVAPVTSSIYNTTPDHLPIGAVAPGLLHAMWAEGSLTKAVAHLSAHAMTDVEQPIGGMFRLVEELVYRLEEDGADLRAAASVTSIRRTTHGLRVNTHDGEEIAAEKLVIATPAAVAARLLSGIGQEIQAPPVGKLRLAILAATTPALKDHPVGSGLLVATKDAVRAKSLSHYSAKWPWAAETGLEVMRLAYPDHVFPTRAEVLSDTSLLTGVKITDAELVGLASIGWDALPSRVEAANRDYLVEQAARVGAVLVGAWLDGNGISNVMAGTHRVLV